MKFSSFRDPAGRVFFDGNEVIRIIGASAREDVEEFLGLKAVADWQANGRLVTADPIDSPSKLNGLAAMVSDGDLVVRHPRVWFPSYPHEWPPEMLEAAGRLTLDMAQSLLPLVWGLKDATPFNVLFQGTKPVFIDVLSFEKRSPGDPIWIPYQQFVNTFLLPLLVNKKCGLSIRTTFLANREGVDVDEANNYLTGKYRFDRTTIGLVTLPRLLSRKAEKTSELYTTQKQLDPAQARYVLERSFGRLGKNLDRVAPTQARTSKWSGYTEHNVTTIPAYMSAKQKFVEDAVRQVNPRSVLDVGCNNGYFSFFAARNGARVVAVDHDPAVVGQVWRNADAEGLDVLPLVIDISKPSPRIGWRNSEVPSFLDRAEGRFDLVMMLAVLHHLIVQDRIPLQDVLRLASDLTTDALVIELVPPSDPLFQKIARGRDHLHADLTEEKFESAAGQFFDIAASAKLEETKRTVYLMRKR